MSWWGYVERIKGADTQDAVADAVGVKGSTITRWKSGGVDPKHARAFAKHYKRPVLEAFVAAGYLTADEANEQPAAEPDLNQLANDELLEAVRARMREEGEIGGDTAATSPATGPAAGLVEELQWQADREGSPTDEKSEFPGELA